MKEEQKNLEQAIKKYDSALVIKLLENKALEETEETDRERILSEITGLRNSEIMKVLAKQLEHFPPQMFAFDMNLRNKEFMNEVFSKYTDKFDLDDRMTGEWAMQLACKAGNARMIKAVLKTGYGYDKLECLAEADDRVFQIIQTVDVDSVPQEVIIKLIIQTARSKDAVNRLRFLKKKGFSLDTKDIGGNSAESILEANLRVKPKNKQEIIKQGQDRNALKQLRAAKEPEKISGMKKILLIAAPFIIIIGVVIGYSVFSSDSKDEGTGEMTENSLDTESDADSRYSTDTGLTVEDGDTVNIDYVGTVDGVEFDGGNTNGEGTDLTIGSGSYIDDFEEQLIGAHVGDTVDVTVTFPEDYGQEELNGKEALFAVTVNGIYDSTGNE